MPAVDSISDRIAEKIKVNGNGCWEWQGWTNHNGYGQIRYNNVKYPVHRLVWILFNGETDLCVLHKCDNPKCCNIEHLFLGTNQDNSHNMVDKGRQIKGEKHGRSKLTANDVRGIRVAAQTRTTRDIARTYGVSQRTICMILNDVTWSHVT